MSESAPFYLYERGNSLLERGNFQEAIALYDKAISQRPQFAGAHYARGDALLRSARPLEAAGAFWAAALYLRFRPEPILMCARALTAAQMYLESCLVFEMVPRDKIDVQSRICYSEALLKEMRIDEAVALSAGLDESQLHMARVLRGAILQEAGRLDEAEQLLRMGIGEDGTGYCHDRLIGVLMARRDWDGLRALLVRAIAKFRDRDFYSAFLVAVDLLTGGQEHPPGGFQGNSRYDLIDAAMYLKARSSRLQLTGHSFQTFDYVRKFVPDAGAICEFGVRNGHSLRYLASSFPDRRLFGFDSFEGIPESWMGEGAGTYSTGSRLPSVPKNVALVPGWFEETLPKFAAQLSEPLAFLNIDCDIYSSTKTIFDTLGSKIKAGTVIVFDEYVGNPTWRQDEFKAFQEWATDAQIKYEYLAASLYTKQVAVRIL